MQSQQLIEIDDEKIPASHEEETADRYIDFLLQRAANQQDEEYKDLILQLEKIRRHIFPEHTELLSGFNDPAILELMDKELSSNNAAHKITQKNFLHLMQSLINFYNALTAIHHHKYSILFTSSCAVLLEGIQLTQEIAKSKEAWISKSDQGYPRRDEKILALTKAMQAATEMVKSPRNLEKTTTQLITATAEMQREIEGPYLLRKENRALCGFLGAIALLVGAALFVGGILALGLSGGTSAFITVGGAVLFSIGVGMLIHAIWPELDQSQNRKNEIQKTHDTMQSMKVLVNSSFTLVAEMSKSHEVAQERTLQPSARSSKLILNS